MSENSEFSPSMIEAVEGTCMDCWRSADTISIMEVEHIAANKKTIVEAIDKLQHALLRLQRDGRK